MKNKKILIIFSALCCMLLMSACEKKQDGTGNAPSSTTASKTEEKSGENTIIDVFSELNVTFEGTNDHGEIICEYTGTNEFVKEYVKFNCPTDYGDFRNGETAVVKLDFNEYKAEQQNIIFKELEREYKVEGLWGSIVSPDGYDFSEVDESAYSFFVEDEKSRYVKNYLDKYLNSQSNQEEDSNLLLITKPDGDIDGVDLRDAAYWRILSLSCEPYAKALDITTNKDSGQENTYIIYYKISVKAEKSPFEVNNASNDTIYNVGDIKEWDFIGGVKYNNVSVEKGSNIVYSIAEPYHSSVLDTNSEYYNADFNTFFDDFIASSKSWYYFYDINSDNPEWEIIK